MKLKTKETKVENCRLCKSSKLTLVYTFKKTPIGDDYLKNQKKVNKYELKLFLCKNCNFVQLSNVIDPDLVYGDYLYVTQTSYGLAEHFKKLSNYLKKKKIVKKNSKILEIGSNDGTLLKYFKNHCSQLIAVDPAAHLFKDNKIKNMGDHFSNQKSTNIRSLYGGFDTIIANNVLANINDLDDIFSGIKNILNDKGYLVVETFSLYGVLKNNLIDNIYHEHLSYFTISSFKKFALKYGLYLKEVKFLKVKGGSLRFIFQNKYLKNSKKIFNALEKERLVINNIQNKFLSLRKINNNNKKKINLEINRIIKKKQKVLGFGASVGTTTLVYDFELENKIDFIFDNEKRRHNLFCPGTKIKVLNPKLIKKYNSNHIIIFAWRYADIIIKKNRKFFKKDTNFIVPLPKFSIL